MKLFSGLFPGGGKGLCDALEVKGGVTALIGSGGKTSLMYHLAGELSRRGTVIITTSTHIRKPEQFPFAATAEETRRLLAEKKCVCIGTEAADGKLTAPAFAGWETMAEYVLVEADGAKGRPLKAHADYEPVIPAGCDNVICVVGASGFDQPVAFAVHRPELFTAAMSVGEQTKVTPVLAAQAVEKEHLYTRVFLNQTDALGGLKANWQVREFAKEISGPVVSGSLRQGIWEKIK